jgi:tetratricopeptide (TPR) repeat protein
MPSVVDVTKLSPALLPTIVKLIQLVQGRRLSEAHALEADWLSHHPAAEEYYWQVAAVYFNAMLFNEANRVVADGLKRYPKSFDLHLLKARSWSVVGELDLVQPELSICQSLRPQSADVHYELASLLNNREDYLGALKEVNLVLAISDKDPNYWVLKGSILRNLNRGSEAVEALSRGIAIGGNSPYFDMNKTRITLARQLQLLKRFPEAMAQYQAAQKLNKRSPYKMYVEIGQCYLDMGKPAEALQNFDKSLAVDDEYLPAHRGRLSALEALKETAGVAKEKVAIKALEADFKPNQ